MKKNIVIIHYNTPLLTECLVRSINLFVEDAIIYIFDNSDKEPFTAKFDNVCLLDNTKGEIINFDKWLEKYPNRFRSGGKANSWGSAKHCYSVEKCMEIINKPFILLDSDVLLKKDISELFDANIVYAGKEVNQPKSIIKRVLPFLCFINTDFCKKHNIHYFNENYMHGLSHNIINKSADSYDTGASFYLNANEFRHLDINLNDYIIHYGHGSWTKNGYERKLTEDEWLKLHKRFWSGERNENVVYTCISGKYDSLKDPNFISEGFDYICFTDNDEFESSIWDIRRLPPETDNLSQVKKQRYIKINPHLVLQDYKLSIWVDGNVSINSDLNNLIKQVMNDNCSIYVPRHPKRKCIYEEAKIVMLLHKDTKENIVKQLERYKNLGFPSNYGLLQSNIIIRKHNNNDCIKFMTEWFDEVKNGSHRDQLSFNYVSWINKDIEIYYLNKNIYNSKWFYWDGKHYQCSNQKIVYIKKNTDKIKKYQREINLLKDNFSQVINGKKLNVYNVGIY